MSVRIPLPAPVHYLFRVIRAQSFMASAEPPDAGTFPNAATGIIVTVAGATGDD